MARGRAEAGRTRSARAVEDASLVIPHYADLARLRACLDNLRASDAAAAEVLVVDNASETAAAEVLDGEYPWVTFVRSPENRGTAGGWNLGARQARGRYLVFLNDDVTVPSEWLGPLLRRLEDPAVGCVCGLALFAEAPDRVNAAGGVCDLLGFGHNRALGAPRDAQAWASGPPLFYAVGTAMAMRRDAWEDVGEFDEAFFMYADDLDWSWRARVAGYDVALEPEAAVYHEWRGSGLSLERTVHLLERNQLRSLLKNYAPFTLALVAPLWMAVKGARILWMALRRSDLARGTAEAWLWNLERLRETLRERRRVQRRRRTRDRDVVAAMVFGSLEVLHALGRLDHPLTASLDGGAKSHG